jgi:hypothetical protein
MERTVAHVSICTKTFLTRWMRRLTNWNQPATSGPAMASAPYRSYFPREVRCSWCSNRRRVSNSRMRLQNVVSHSASILRTRNYGSLLRRAARLSGDQCEIAKLLVKT